MARKTAEGVEAAAVAAAIAQFEAEFGAAPAPERPQTPAWQRAALMEGVGAKETIEELRGGSKWLS
ncbi:MAG TPA: hypothetical protein VHH14_07515 [Solirubrobacterales bacterium]|nr:hypothetical protein [Solirubrobacterales bacterium]